MDQKKLSESELCDKVIRPAMVGAGWDTLDQIYAQYPLRVGRVVVRGNKSHRDQNTVLYADYALFQQQWRRLCVPRRHDDRRRAGTKHHPGRVPRPGRTLEPLLRLDSRLRGNDELK